MKSNENTRPQDELQCTSIIENKKNQIISLSKMQYLTKFQRSYINSYVYNDKDQMKYHGPFQTFVQVKDSNSIWRRVYSWSGFFNKSQIEGNVELIVYMRVKNKSLILLQQGCQHLIIPSNDKTTDTKITIFLLKHFGININENNGQLPKFKYSNE